MIKQFLSSSELIFLLIYLIVIGICYFPATEHVGTAEDPLMLETPTHRVYGSSSTYIIGRITIIRRL